MVGEAALAPQLVELPSWLRSLLGIKPVRNHPEHQPRPSSAALRKELGASLAGYIPRSLSLPELLYLKHALTTGSDSVSAFVLALDLAHSSSANVALKNLESHPKSGMPSLPLAVTLDSLSALMKPELLENVATEAGLKNAPLLATSHTGDGYDVVVMRLRRTATGKFLDGLSDQDVAKFMTALASKFASLLSVSGTSRAEIAAPLAAAPSVFGSQSIPLGHRIAITAADISFKTLDQLGRQRALHMIGPALTQAARINTQSKEFLPPHSSPVMIDERVAKLLGIHTSPAFTARLSHDDMPDIPVQLLSVIKVKSPHPIVVPPTIIKEKAAPSQKPSPSVFTPEGALALMLESGIPPAWAELIAQAPPHLIASQIIAALTTLKDMQKQPNPKHGKDYVPPFLPPREGDEELLNRATQIGHPPSAASRLRRITNATTPNSGKNYIQ